MRGNGEAVDQARAVVEALVARSSNEMEKALRVAQKTFRFKTRLENAETKTFILFLHRFSDMQDSTGTILCYRLQIERNVEPTVAV